MRNFKLAIILLGVFLLFGLEKPALAADNSITLGFSDLQIINLDYETVVSDNLTLNIDYGLCILFFIASDDPEWPTYGIGFNWYFKDHAFDGGYTGVHITHVEAKGDFYWDDVADSLIGTHYATYDEFEPFEYYTLALGYKKALDNRFTYDLALHAVYWDGWSYGLKASWGYSW